MIKITRTVDGETFEPSLIMKNDKNVHKLVYLKDYNIDFEKIIVLEAIEDLFEVTNKTLTEEVVENIPKDLEWKGLEFDSYRNENVYKF